MAHSCLHVHITPTPAHTHCTLMPPLPCCSLGVLTFAHPPAQCMGIALTLPRSPCSSCARRGDPKVLVPGRAAPFPTPPDSPGCSQQTPQHQLVAYRGATYARIGAQPCPGTDRAALSLGRLPAAPPAACSPDCQAPRRCGCHLSARRALEGGQGRRSGTSRTRWLSWHTLSCTGGAPARGLAESSWVVAPLPSPPCPGTPPCSRRFADGTQGPSAPRCAGGHVPAWRS